jgi:hypothetical protein
MEARHDERPQQPSDPRGPHIYGRRPSRWQVQRLLPGVAGQPGRRRHRGGLAVGRCPAGPEAVRTIVGSIRRLYDHQEFKFAGPYGDNGFLEDYTAQVRGEPIGRVALVTRNAAGRPGTSRRTTGHAARCSSCLACWARSSRAPPMPTTSSSASPETNVPTTAGTQLRAQHGMECSDRWNGML